MWQLQESAICLHVLNVHVHVHTFRVCVYILIMHCCALKCISESGLGYLIIIELFF